MYLPKRKNCRYFNFGRYPRKITYRYLSIPIHIPTFFVSLTLRKSRRMKANERRYEYFAVFIYSNRFPPVTSNISISSLQKLKRKKKCNSFFRYCIFHLDFRIKANERSAKRRTWLIFVAFAWE